jgi:hypothetical protein
MEKVKATKMLFNWSMKEQTMLYPYKGILFSNKKEMSYQATKKIWMNLKCMVG